LFEPVIITLDSNQHGRTTTGVPVNHRCSSEQVFVRGYTVRAFIWATFSSILPNYVYCYQSHLMRNRIVLLLISNIAP